MFKYALLVLALCAIASAKMKLSGNLAKMAMDIHDKCLKEVGATEDDFGTFAFGKKDHKQMCYMKCSLIAAKFITPQETLDVDFLEKNIHPDLKKDIVPLVQQCKDSFTGSAECEKSYNFYNCGYEKSPDLIYIW